MNPGNAPTAVGYRVEVLEAPTPGEIGERYELSPPELDPSRYRVRITPVQLGLARGVELRRSGSGEWLFYYDNFAYGQRLEQALTSEWVTVFEDAVDPAADGAPAR